MTINYRAKTALAWLGLSATSALLMWRHGAEL
jgi:hypothetical protein